MMSVDINSLDYDVYADVSTAEAYFAAAIHASSWDDAAELTKKQALVTATRLLDRQSWATDYDTQAKREDVVNIQNASIELALSLIDGSTVQNDQNTAERVRSISAGSVSITNFRGVDSATLRFPLIVQELLRGYLAGADAAYVSVATGVDSETDFPVDLTVTTGL